MPSRVDTQLLFYLADNLSEARSGAPESDQEGPVKLEPNKWISRAQLKLWAILLSITVLGVMGIFFHDKILYPWLDHLVKEISPGLFTAGILAFTVDMFLKRELARDVFVAAFR